MLFTSMDYAEQIEEHKIKQVRRELRKTRVEHSNYSNTRSEVQDKPRFKKIFSNQGPSNTPVIHKGIGSTPKPQEGKGHCPYVDKPISTKCGIKHVVKCVVSTGKCYSCGNTGHIERDFPMMKGQVRENYQAQDSAPNLYARKKKFYYALCFSVDQEDSPDFVECMLQVFSINVFTLLYPAPHYLL